MSLEKKDKRRCAWAVGNPLMENYHDNEWGKPLHDDRRLFEFLVLEGAQAGLSWQTILKKRERYREIFDDFDASKVARYGEAKVREILSDPGIVRNRLKVEAVIGNARAFLKVREEFGSFDRYVWSFVGGRTIKNRFKSFKEIPSSTKESEAMSKDLMKRGFRFVGPTICYAFMQAVGMVDDHEVGCFRRHE